MFCSKCGNQVTDTAKFCPKCGKPVGISDESVLPPIQPPAKNNTYAPLRQNYADQPPVQKQSLRATLNDFWLKLMIGGACFINAAKEKHKTFAIDPNLYTWQPDGGAPVVMKKPFKQVIKEYVELFKAGFAAFLVGFKNPIEEMERIEAKESSPNQKEFSSPDDTSEVNEQANNTLSNVKSAHKPKKSSKGGLLVVLLPLGLIVASLISFLVFGAKDCGRVSYNYISYSVGSVFSPDRYEPNAWGYTWNASGTEADAKALNKLCRERRFEKGGIGMLVSAGVGLSGAVWIFVAMKADEKKQRQEKQMAAGSARQ